MRKIYSKILALILVIVSMNEIKAQAFTVGAPSNDYTLTCLNPVVTMTANSGNAPYTYTWATTGSTINGSYAQITIPGSWTVTGQNLTSTVTSQSTFTVYQNLQSPTIAVTPTVENITCPGGSGCFTLTSNLSPNVTTNWYTISGSNKIYVGSAQGTINIWCPGNPGIYWAESTFNNTGCSASKSVQVTSSVGVPIFTVTSPTNFTIGCGSTSVTSMQINPVITSPVPNSPVNYTIMPPPVTSTPTTFAASPNLNNITVPGIYAVYVKDLTNNCVSSMSINVIQNTVTANIYYIQPLSLLTCANASMALTAISNNTNTIITWTVPPTNSVNPTHIQNVYTSSAVPNATTMLTSLGSYSIGAVNLNNQCRSTYTVQIIQDIRMPVFTIAALSNSVITCTNPDAVLVPIITPTLAVSLVPTYVWYAPPSGPGVPGTQYNTTVGGTHTCISTSATNGCTVLATYVVGVDQMVGAIGGTIGVSCPVTTAVVSPTFVVSTSALTFTWSGPGGSITSPINQSTISVNSTGNYTCIVTNTNNGCTDTIQCVVTCNNGIAKLGSNIPKVSVYPNPSKGAITIELSVINSEMKMSIYDTQGKLLNEKTLNSKINKMDTDLPKGCYFYRITCGNEVVKRDKLIIE